MNISPQASQTVLVLFMVGGILSMVISAYLLSKENHSGYAFLAICVCIFGLTYRGWATAQPDTDMASSHPTTVALPDGTRISTDSRVVRNPSALKSLAELLTVRPLPPPTALLDANGEIIPGSARDAASEINRINSEMLARSNELADAFSEAPIPVSGVAAPVGDVRISPTIDSPRPATG